MLDGIEIRDLAEDMAGFEHVAQLQTTAFPPDECWTMDEILELVENPRIEYKTFWNGDQLCAIMFYDTGDTMVYLFYLAVSPELRSQGFGARLLRWIREAHPNHSIVLNIESPYVGTENEDQRLRRLGFYERNGFHRVPVRLKDDTGLYDILTSEGFDGSEYLALIEELGFGPYGPVLVPVAD